ncbi:MAG TPA: LCP family protein [Candidatus Saccharimonadales bacterium]|nr:LCP family protein [Candidatus Saccharimonadales bacterium]
MQPKSRRTPPINGSARPRPGQDIITAKKQAGNFPGVGMTLPTYRSNAAGRARLGGPSRTQTQPGRLKRIFSKRHLKRAALSLLVLLILIGGFVGFKFLYNAHKLFGGSILGVLHTTKLKGEDSGRVNILLAGNSADDPGHNGGDLTDSIMILSIDTRNNTAFLLSVPRDLWVDIPGGGHQKINAAYVVGNEDNFSESGYPQGGMGLLEKVIHDNLGIPIDYYALINYNALRDSVNAVGGVTFTVDSSDPRGLYDPSIDYKTHGPLVRLSNGPHVLNGEQALDLARARGDAYGSYGFDNADFTRTENQRQLLIDLKNKATTAGVLTNPAKLTKLSDAVGNNVKTDFTLSEVHRLVDLVKPIGSKNIKSLSLNDANGKDLLTSYTTADGESALIPAAGIDDFSDIQAFVHQQTSNNPVVRENAGVVVLNATDISGLASQERTKLKVKGLNITDIGDALTNQATTSIIDNSGGKKPATRQLLVQLFGNNVTTTNPYGDKYDADFIILLGNDQAAGAANNN